MGYKEMISSGVEAVYRKGIANKILQFMQKIRNEYDEGQARRWPMELLQNGRDVAYKDSKLKARFELTDEELIYSHNGMPFRVKDILSIIYQVSSKQPGDESVGQFGTGFMSTHQLCERVKLNGVLKDQEEEYCPFEVMLDRTGKEAEEILEKIMESVEQINLADGNRLTGAFDKEAYNTRFTYFLEKPLNKQTARIGMDDLKENVLYVMLFSERIQEITLVQNMSDVKSEVTYSRGADESINSDGTIRRLMIVEKNARTNEQTEHRMIYLTENEVTVAAGMNEKNCFLPISPKTPRLFVDFPLIGAEEFPFPAVVNSGRLQPNEPRSGIALSDNPNSYDSVQNRKVISEAVELYGKLFAFAVEEQCQGLEYLISIPAWKENKEHSENWVRCNLYKNLYRKVAVHPFIQTNDGKRSLAESCVSLIRGETEEERNGVRELLLALKGFRVPLDDVDWPSALSGYELPEEKVIGLSEVLQKKEQWLTYYLDEARCPFLDWCQKLYDLAMRKEETALLVRSGQIRIYPSQSESDIITRKLYTVQEIKADPGIAEILKDVSEELDKLNSAENEPIMVRKNLLHKAFRTLGEVPVFESSRLYEYIRRRSYRGFQVIGYMTWKYTFDNAWRCAWELLLSCGEDESVYRLYEKIAPDGLRPYQKLEGVPADLFRNAYVNLCKAILEQVQACNTLDGVKTRLCSKETEEEMYQWLNAVLARAYYYLSETEVLEYRVLPNQEGTLVGRYIEQNNDGWRTTERTKLDATKTEELKEILRVFADKREEYNLYRELVDQNIVLENSSLSSLNDETVAMKLNSRVQQLLSEHNISDVKAEYQDACTRILAYIQENTEMAKRYFPGFCNEEEQMRLLSPKAAVRMQQQAKQMQQLFASLGVDSAEDIMELVERARKMQEAVQEDFSDEYGDVFIEADWHFDSEEEKKRMLREIGTAGERYAFEEVCRGFSEWTEEEKTEHRALYKSADGRNCAVVEYPDTDTYKQSGWDISIRYSGEEERLVYVEVKTHTTKSIVKNEIGLSKQQMMMALKHRENYAVIMVSYSRQEKGCVGASLYQNPMALFVQGKLRSYTEKYVFLT